MRDGSDFKCEIRELRREMREIRELRGMSCVRYVAQSAYGHLRKSQI